MSSAGTRESHLADGAVPTRLHVLLALTAGVKAVVVALVVLRGASHCRRFRDVWQKKAEE